jgi:hypothetical protein
MNDLNNTVILTVDEPNKNGRIYPRVEIEKALTRLPDPFLGFIGMEEQSLERTTHIVDSAFTLQRYTDALDEREPGRHHAWRR